MNNMKDFKFLVFNKPKTAVSYFKLKDPFNRTKPFMHLMSEYPYDKSNVKLFMGNILEFYNNIKSIQETQRITKIPTIYEVDKRYRGERDVSTVYSNYLQHDHFISRKYFLRIYYSI